MERKLAVIFYSDVADYSRHTGADEEGTHRVLGETLDLITARVTESRGRVIHYAGDAVLAEFSSAIGAYECATGIQTEMRARNENLEDERKFEIRIGINLGDVIVDRDDIYGDGVNVAARLETLAPPGGICISASVHGQVSKKSPYPFRDLGEQRVKNIADPVRAYSVLLDGEPEPEGRRRLSPFWRGKLIGGAVTAAILIVLAEAFWVATEPEEPSIPAAAADLAPTVAVLPFRTIGVDTKGTGFGAGLTQDVITELAARTKFRVVATKGVEGDDARKIGQSLKSRYVLEGSVRFADNALRVSALLVDARSGINLWAGRYDRPAGDVLDIQVDVAQNIVGTLSEKLSTMSPEAEPASPPAQTAEVETRMMRALEFIGRVVEQVVMMPQDLLRRIAGGSGEGGNG